MLQSYYHLQGNQIEASLNETRFVSIFDKTYPYIYNKV